MLSSKKIIIANVFGVRWIALKGDPDCFDATMSSGRVLLKKVVTPAKAGVQVLQYI
jgi:hypothetical protein